MDDISAWSGFHIDDTSFKPQIPWKGLHWDSTLLSCSKPSFPRTVAADDADQQPTAESAFFFQYEADIFKPLLMDLGHVHEFGVTVETTHTRDRLYAKGVYADFSLPVGSRSI